MLKWKKTVLSFFPLFFQLHYATRLTTTRNLFAECAWPALSMSKCRQKQAVSCNLINELIGWGVSCLVSVVAQESLIRNSSINPTLVKKKNRNDQRMFVFSQRENEETLKCFKLMENPLILFNLFPLWISFFPTAPATEGIWSVSVWHIHCAALEAWTPSQMGEWAETLVVRGWKRWRQRGRGAALRPRDLRCESKRRWLRDSWQRLGSPLPQVPFMWLEAWGLFFFLFLMLPGFPMSTWGSDALLHFFAVNIWTSAEMLQVFTFSSHAKVKMKVWMPLTYSRKSENVQVLRTRIQLADHFTKSGLKVKNIANKLYKVI